MEVAEGDWLFAVKRSHDHAQREQHIIVEKFRAYTVAGIQVDSELGSALFGWRGVAHHQDLFQYF